MGASDLPGTRLAGRCCLKSILRHRLSNHHDSFGSNCLHASWCRDANAALRAAVRLRASCLFDDAFFVSSTSAGDAAAKVDRFCALHCSAFVGVLLSKCIDGSAHDVCGQPNDPCCPGAAAANRVSSWFT